MPATSRHDPPLLEVCQLFRSIAGETTQAGRPALFVRLSGCNLNCSWCDTPQARRPGRSIPVKELLRRMARENSELVVLTGGEPLLQPACLDLCRSLLASGREVLVETNGSLDTGILPAGVKTILDMKPPSSGESEKMKLENLARLKVGDELKIVVADRGDFAWAVRLLARRKPAAGVPVLFSPAWGLLDPARLAEWLLARRPPGVRLQLQLHKFVWPDGRDGVPLPLNGRAAPRRRK